MQIEIDFDAYKALTNLLENERDTYSNAVRRLLKLPNLIDTIPESTPQAVWFGYEVNLPVETKLRAVYKHKEYSAQVKIDGLEVDGKVYPSLSSAGISIVGQNINGWNFWKYFDSRSRTWRPMMELRH